MEGVDSVPITGWRRDCPLLPAKNSPNMLAQVWQASRSHAERAVLSSPDWGTCCGAVVGVVVIAWDWFGPPRGSTTWPARLAAPRLCGNGASLPTRMLSTQCG